jgi:Ca2+-binding RTX toxin-like protein
MIGGDGNDTYSVDIAADVVTATNANPLTGGMDTIRSSVSRSLGANQENLILCGIAAINGNGNSFANRLTGNPAANTLRGRGGISIGSATTAYATGSRHLFAVVNGSSSALFLFSASGNDALVSAGELKPITSLQAKSSLQLPAVERSAVSGPLRGPPLS